MDHLTYIKNLLHILYDTTARDDEQDDAIMDLGNYDNLIVECSLVFAAHSLDLDEILLASIGESLAQIWLRKKKVNTDYLKILPYSSQHEAIEYINALQPSLLLYENYKIEKKYKKLLCPICIIKNNNLVTFNIIKKATIIKNNQQIFICKKCKLIWLDENEINKDNAQSYAKFMQSLGLNGTWKELKDVDIL